MKLDIASNLEGKSKELSSEDTDLALIQTERKQKVCTANCLVASLLGYRTSLPLTAAIFIKQG